MPRPEIAPARQVQGGKLWPWLARSLDRALPLSSDVLRRVVLACLFSVLILKLAYAEEETERRVIVNANESGEEFEEPGGYGQPQWAERSRASATTKLYVLSPFEVFVGVRSESDVLRHRDAVHSLIEEIELGLPYRFEIDFENQLGVIGSRLGETDAALGARYALAAWGKIPLNPAVSATYQIGTGDRLADRFDRRSDQKQTDACELRLLLGQEFVPRLQWAANVFFQHALGSDHDREVGFTQNIAYLAIADKLELGTEMRYTNATRKGEHRSSANEFVIGPSVNWKPNLHTVVSLAPLFGCTSDSPRVAILTSISLEFGGGESKTVRTPARR